MPKGIHRKRVLTDAVTVVERDGDVGYAAHATKDPEIVATLKRLVCDIGSVRHTARWLGKSSATISNMYHEKRGVPHDVARSLGFYDSVERERRRFFWSRVTRAGDDECWLWTGAVSGGANAPYGVLKFPGAGRVKATHFALMLAGFPRPAGGHACHRCDVTRCVNPRHLYWGDAATNMADCSARGRKPRGEAVTGHKLREMDVVNMRKLWRLTAHLNVHDSRKFGYSRLARMFGVTTAAAMRAVTGRMWAHITVSDNLVRPQDRAGSTRRPYPASEATGGSNEA